MSSQTPQKPDVSFEIFEDLDMRVARVISAPMAEGSRFPSRVIILDLGHLGQRTSVGQYALVSEDELVGKNVIVCVNLGERKMGKYLSQALVMGAPHPSSPADQAQATPLLVSDDAHPGDRIF